MADCLYIFISETKSNFPFDDAAIIILIICYYIYIYADIKIIISINFSYMATLCH